MPKSAMTISQCDAKKKVTGSPYTLMLNPSKLKRHTKISYDRTKAIGITGVNQKFEAIEPEDVCFTFVIDGTGVVKQIKSVLDEMKQLCAVVYDYSGDKHEPSRVQIIWGTLTFYGRMTSMDVDYKLFLPDGDPLRAEVSLAFTSFMTEEEEAARTNKSSPDLTHLVEVKAGDTLPLLCQRIYDDCSYYREVAAFNNLVEFRRLAPGTKLQFPPLR